MNAKTATLSAAVTQGALMIILAHLVSLNGEWSGCGIRIIRAVRSREDSEDACREMKALMTSARMENAEIKAIIAHDDFRTTLLANSKDASLTFLGFRIPTAEQAIDFQNQFAALLEGMPAAMLIHSTGEADLMS
jgi:hypothetical protein